MAIELKPYASMTAEDHAARAQAYAWLKANGYRERGRKTQRERAAEVAKVVADALCAAGLTVEGWVSEERQRAGGYYVVSHDWKHGPVVGVEYIPTPAERVEWKLPGGWS